MGPNEKARSDPRGNMDHVGGAKNLPDWTDTKYIHVKEGRLDVVDVAGAASEVNMDEPGVLANFIKEGATRYKADKYALFLWDHGGSWDGTPIMLMSNTCMHCLCTCLYKHLLRWGFRSYPAR